MHSTIRESRREQPADSFALRDLLVAEGNKQEVDPKNGISPGLRMWHRVYVQFCFESLAEGGCP